MSSSENPQFEPLPPSKGDGHADIPVPPEILGPIETAPVPPIAPPPRQPVENPPWSGWDVLLIVVLAFVSIVCLQYAIVYGAHYFLFPHQTILELAQRPMLLLIAQFLIDSAVGILIFLLIEGKYHVRFWNAIKWNWPSAAWRMLGLGAVMLLGLSMLENFLPMPKEVPFDKLFAHARDAYLLAIIAVSLGPLVEEIFFRGFFYPVIARRWGAGWGVFLSALPFAAMHLPQYGYAWTALLVVMIVGLVCGTVRAVTGSVAASFLVHVGYNGTQMLIALVWTRGFTHLPKTVWFG